MSTFHWHCSDRNSNLCLNRSIWTLFHIKCAVLISLDLIFYGKHRFSFWGPRGHGDIKSASTLFIESQVKRVGTKLSLLFGNWVTWPFYNQCSVLKSVLQISIPTWHPCVGLILAQHYPLELSAVMDILYCIVQYGSHYPHLSPEHMKCGYSNWGNEFLILINLQLNFYTWLVTTVF